MTSHEEAEHPIAVKFGCMDRRHSRGDKKNLDDALREVTGVNWDFYHLTEPGGVGIFARATAIANPLFGRLAQPLVRAWALYKIRLAVSLGAKKIFLTIHGSSHQDANGCGGYKVCGYAHCYATAETSRTFSQEELRRAGAWLKKHKITIPMRAFYVTFDEEGNNFLEEVALDKSALA